MIRAPEQELGRILYRIYCQSIPPTTIQHVRWNWLNDSLKEKWNGIALEFMRTLSW